MLAISTLLTRMPLDTRIELPTVIESEPALTLKPPW
jgi:hypothetical protein